MRLQQVSKCLSKSGAGCNVREEMVNNVLLNDAVEDVLANKAKVAVNGSESALDKGPALLGVVRDLLVVVVQVGDGN